MKTTKFTYYNATMVTSAIMIFIAFETLTKPEVKVPMEHVGFPNYFRIEWGLAKLVGAVLI